ncbi:MAG: YfbU family protein [Geminicoccaceae bacterium]
MATVSFRIDDDLKSELDHLSETKGVNVSDLFRRSLRKVVEEMHIDRSQSPDFKLSLINRLALRNQYKILKLLGDTDEDNVAMQQLLMEGYESEYRQLVLAFDPEGVSVATSREVLKVLDMHRMMRNAYEDLGDDCGVTEKDIYFRGYDGNNEVDQISFVRYFVDTLGRYSSLQRERHEYDSHTQMVPRYKAMIRAWESSDNPNHLTKEDLRRIVDARRG